MSIKEDTDSNAPKDDEARSGDPEPLPSWAKAMKKAEPPSDECHRSAERRHWRHQEWANKITLGISIVALIGAFCTINISQSSLNAAIEAARQAKEQAGAAQAANMIATTALSQVQRSFVYFTDIEMIENEIVNTEFSVRAIVKNSGNTPANIESISFAIAPRAHDYIAAAYPNGIPPNPKSYLGDNAITFMFWCLGSPSDPEMAINRRNGTVLKSITIHPQQELRVPELERTIDVSDMMPAIRANKLIPYIFGIIRYRDVLTDDIHVTKFCREIEGATGGRNGKISYHHCIHWNCDDEVCKKDKESYDAAFREMNEKPKNGIGYGCSDRR